MPWNPFCHWDSKQVAVREAEIWVWTRVFCLLVSGQLA